MTVERVAGEGTSAMDTVSGSWSPVPGHSPPQWLVQSRYRGRAALQVGLGDVEIAESGPRAGRCTKYSVVYTSLEGCIMQRRLPPVALGVTLIVIPSPHRGKQGPGGMEFP